jgi:hypothetical protein
VTFIDLLAWGNKLCQAKTRAQNWSCCGKHVDQLLDLGFKMAICQAPWFREHQQQTCCDFHVWLVVSNIFYYPFHIWDVIRNQLTNSIIFHDG